MLNKICAYPVVISWFWGALATNIAFFYYFLHDTPWSVTVADAQTVFILLFTFIPLTLLGFFLGMFTCWPLIRVICCKCNGNLLAEGDQVMILSGPQKGKIVEVREMRTGQGGWAIAKVDLAGGRKYFPLYSLLKINHGKTQIRPELPAV